MTFILYPSSSYSIFTHHILFTLRSILVYIFRQKRSDIAIFFSRMIMRYFLYTPFTYTDFSYESLRIAQIHGSFTDPYDLATFTTDLRVVTNYYELFTVCYGLLLVITIYLRQNFTICYELARITTSNLSVSNDLLTCCYE